MRGRWTAAISNVREMLESKRHTLVAVVTEVRHLGDAFEDQFTPKADGAMMKTIRAPMMLKGSAMNETSGSWEHGARRR